MIVSLTAKRALREPVTPYSPNCAGGSVGSAVAARGWRPTMSMSFLISFREISKRGLSATRCTANIPRRVIASDVITLLYGRGLGVAPPAP